MTHSQINHTKVWGFSTLREGEKNGKEENKRKC